MSDAARPYVVVVGTDYSEAADLALLHALDLAAEKPFAEVHVVNVLAPLAPDYWETPVRPSPAGLLSLNEAAARLKSHVDSIADDWRARRAPEAGSVRIILHQRVEAPAREIAKLAADVQADLVVVGTHGRRGLARLVLGSVAESAVRLAPCPVLVVRPKLQADTALRHEPPSPDETREKPSDVPPL